MLWKVPATQKMRHRRWHAAQTQGALPPRRVPVPPARSPRQKPAARRSGSRGPAAARRTVSARPRGGLASLRPPGRAHTHLGALGRLRAIPDSRPPGPALLPASRPLKPGRLDRCPPSPASPGLRFSATWSPGPRPSSARFPLRPRSRKRSPGARAAGRGLATLGAPRK